MRIRAMSGMLIMVILGGFIFILTGCNKKEEPLEIQTKILIKA